MGHRYRGERDELALLSGASDEARNRSISREIRRWRLGFLEEEQDRFGQGEGEKGKGMGRAEEGMLPFSPMDKAGALESSMAGDSRTRRRSTDHHERTTPSSSQSPCCKWDAKSRFCPWLASRTTSCHRVSLPPISDTQEATRIPSLTCGPRKMQAPHISDRGWRHCLGG
jgi:hypothetical protein